MEQMVYELLSERFVLESGQYIGYNFWIISYGTHPCAYVELPQTHPYFGKCNSDAYELNIDVHGGITYGYFGLGNIVDDKKFLLGWDYNHCTDYNPMTNALFEEHLKRWTTEEILEEVKDVIKQLHIADVSKKVGGKMISIQDIIPFMRDGWVAMDEDGKWCFFNYLPTIYKGKFGNMLDRVELYRGFDIAPADDWTKSLIKVGGK